jgi:hypothetical protein
MSYYSFDSTKKWVLTGKYCYKKDFIIEGVLTYKTGELKCNKKILGSRHLTIAYIEKNPLEPHQNILYSCDKNCRRIYFVDNDGKQIKVLALIKLYYSRPILHNDQLVLLIKNSIIFSVPHPLNNDLHEIMRFRHTRDIVRMELKYKTFFIKWHTKENILTILYNNELLAKQQGSIMNIYCPELKEKIYEIHFDKDGNRKTKLCSDKIRTHKLQIVRSFLRSLYSTKKNDIFSEITYLTSQIPDMHFLKMYNFLIKTPTNDSIRKKLNDAFNDKSWKFQCVPWKKEEYKRYINGKFTKTTIVPTKFPEFDEIKRVYVSDDTKEPSEISISSYGEHGELLSMDGINESGHAVSVNVERKEQKQSMIGYKLARTIEYDPCVVMFRVLSDSKVTTDALCSKWRGSKINVVWIKKIKFGENNEIIYLSDYVRTECDICYDNVVNAIVDPCRHRICMSCWDKITIDKTQCPFCRGKVNKISAISHYLDNKDVEVKEAYSAINTKEIVYIADTTIVIPDSEFDDSRKTCSTGIHFHLKESDLIQWKEYFDIPKELRVFNLQQAAQLDEPVELGDGVVEL